MPSSKSGQKPSYLGLLNAIAVAETAAEPLFLAWADRTDDRKLAETLRFVGMREGEHGKAFAKRMLELGYEVRQGDGGPNPELLKIAGSRRSDLRKFEELGFGRGLGESDVFDGMFADKNIDPVTGGLLGRYIAEERDSARRLNADYERIKRADARKKSARKSARKKPAAK
ncbi:MAG: hypothetical protein ACR2QK_15525 [Acidimicrobiales bacterium]